MSPKPRKERAKSYVPAPSIPKEHLDRYMLIMKTAVGQMTVAEGARRLGVSRNHFQTLMHRGLGALIEAILPHPPGRPPRSEREMELEEEVERLSRQLDRMQSEVETSHRLLAVASEVLRGHKTPSRQRSSRTKKAATTGEGPEEPEPEADALLTRVTQMRTDGIRARHAASAVGLGASTLRRWAARRKKGEPLRRRRGPPHQPRAVDPTLEESVARRVRELRGLVGAESLRRTFCGVSRRAALAIKRRTLTEMERARKARHGHVTVRQPGVIRGFDAMHLTAGDADNYALIAADGCVPYRTLARDVARYDSPSVVEALAEDIAQHGAPLVYRLDRASCQRTDDVQELLEEHGVLALHGPAHYPCFYGQLERQNREHRAWLDLSERGPNGELSDELSLMRHALNDLWCRRTLGWRTAGELWRARPNLRENRIELRRAVVRRAAHLEAKLAEHRDAPDRAWRLAIEQELTLRGYLHVQHGRWC